jgi:hypothetical protein
MDALCYCACGHSQSIDYGAHLWIRFGPDEALAVGQAVGLADYFVYSAQAGKSLI